MEVISFLFNIILATVLIIVKIILAPIDYLIAQLLPDMSNSLTAVAEYLQLVGQGMGWAISAGGIPYSAIALIATFWIFKLTAPINIWFIKLAIKWFHALKP